jgi:hypothetical protein
MRASGAGFIGAFWLGTIGAAGPLVAQDSTGVSLSAYAQVQFATSNGGDDARESTFLMRRVRLRVDINAGDGITGRVEPDFAGGGARLRYAWLALDLGSVTLRGGVFKKPFSRIELTSSSRMPVIERALAIDGLADAYAGDAPELPLLDDEFLLAEEQYLLTAFGYHSYDVGALLIGSAGRLGYEVGVFNGSGTAGLDDTNGKAVSARVTYGLAADLPFELGAAVTRHEREVADETRDGTAVEVDAQIGRPGDPGPGLIAEAVQGDSFAEDATFRGVQAYAWHRWPMTGRVTAVEGLARVSWGDPSTDRAQDGGTLFTPGLNVYVGRHARLMLQWDVHVPQDDRLRTGHAFRAQAQLIY